MEQVINKKSLNASLSKNIFLYIAFASLALVSSYEAPLTVDVPFPGILIFIFCLLIHCCINGVNSIKFGTISCLLLLRLFLFLINALILSARLDIILEQTVTTIISILIFECFRNSSEDKTTVIKRVLLIFSFLTSLQLLVGFVGNLFSDKNEIVSGIGNSNYAATFLLMTVSFLLFVKTKWYEKVILILDIFSLLLTQSFGAYLALGVVIVIYVIKRFDWHLVKSWLVLLIFLNLFSLLVYYFIGTDIGSEIYKKVMFKIEFLLAGDWQSFGSSRLELYEFSWLNIKNNFLLGSVTNYNPNVDITYRFQNFKTHNFILESLLLFGLVGTVINFIIAGLILKKLSKKNRKIKLTAYIVTIIAIFTHGFIEPNLFTMHFEPFIWMILGGLLAKIKTSN